MQSPAADLVALDIETTGLEAESSAVVAAALAARGGTEVFSTVDETALLAALEHAIADLPGRSTIVTWNGAEFDLPFLAKRYARRHVRSTLKVRLTGELGKYGKPLVEASWAGHPHVDIAPLFRETAARLGVQWSLKPVVRALLNTEPIEVDRHGEAIACLAPETLREYVTSDATITLGLAEMLDRSDPRVVSASNNQRGRKVTSA